jgi:ketosteroid isomerase-like protein
MSSNINAQKPLEISFKNGVSRKSIQRVGIKIKFYIMKKFLFLGLFAVMCLTACNNQQKKLETSQQTIDSLNAVIALDHSSEAAGLMETDIKWSQTAETNNAEGFLSYYASGAILLPPNEKMLTDKEAIEKEIKGMFSSGVSVKWLPIKAEVSRSGDMGYTVGTYKMESKDKKGKVSTETGKYMEFWKKQADGSWKAVTDMFSADGTK